MRIASSRSKRKRLPVAKELLQSCGLVASTRYERMAAGGLFDCAHLPATPWSNPRALRGKKIPALLPLDVEWLPPEETLGRAAKEQGRARARPRWPMSEVFVAFAQDGVP